MNKKGNLPDILFTIVICFAIIIGLVSFLKPLDDISVQLNNSAELNNVTKDQINTYRSITPKTVNIIFVFAFFGAFISIVVSAFLVRSNLAFFFIAVLTLAVFVFVAATLSNTYESYLDTDPALESYVLEHFALSNHIMNNYVIYVVVMGFLIIIALYAKTTTVGNRLFKVTDCPFLFFNSFFKFIVSKVDYEIYK